MLKPGFSIALALIISGCPAPVLLPKITPEQDAVQTAAMPSEPLARGNPGLKRVPLDSVKFTIYQSGDKNELGLTVTPELAQAYAAYHRRDISVLSTLDALSSKSADPMLRWVAGGLRLDALVMLGRAADAETSAEEVATRERKILGHDLLSSRSLRDPCAGSPAWSSQTTT